MDLRPASSISAARQKVADEIGAACRNTGFFYITHHGIDQALVERAFAESKRFFDLPSDRKKKLTKKPGTNGYEPVETQRLDNESPGDLEGSLIFSAAAKPGTPDYVPKSLAGRSAGFP